MDKIRAEKICRIAYDRICGYNIHRFKNSGRNIILISDKYPGIWLEHTYDAVALAKYDKKFIDIAKNQISVFIDNQKKDGQLPCYVLDENNPATGEFKSTVGYSQIQECVSFASLCVETYMLSQDVEFLKKCYNACRKWDLWLENNRMTTGKGLIELFCGFDSGHDKSMRFADIACPGNYDDKNAAICPPCNIVPIIAPDMNAVFYGNKTALSEMAAILGEEKVRESYINQAQEVKMNLMNVCYDREDNYFYDVDKNGNKRKIRSISIASLFAEHVLDEDVAERIYGENLRNPKRFWTEIPFPSVSADDGAFKKNASGNSWNYYSQGLTALRTLRWMEYYGKTNDMRYVMERWLDAQANAVVPFGQEYDPFCAEPSDSSPWYSSAMIYALWAGYTLYGIKI